jgi:hypothetical protein
MVNLAAGLSEAVSRNAASESEGVISNESTPNELSKILPNPDES